MSPENPLEHPYVTHQRHVGRASARHVGLKPDLRFIPKNPFAYRQVAHQPERPVKLPCGPGRRGALAVVFGWRNFYGIGPEAALQHHTSCGMLLAVQRDIAIAREPDSERTRVSCRLMDNPGSLGNPR